MKRLILADTGPLVALLNPRDHYHEWALARFDEFSDPLATCEAVLTETLFLLSTCPGASASLMELWQRESIQVDFSAEREKPVLRKLMAKYGDLPMSFADACLVRMSELHATASVWTLDTDFGVYRRNGRQSIPLCRPAA
ncbi:MAG: type II toxin-antitoxin system VapC family toxin [Verrucomicrobiales bacterium]